MSRFTVYNYLARSEPEPEADDSFDGGPTQSPSGT